MTAYQAEVKRFNAVGVTLLAASVDTPKPTAKMRRELGLHDFTLLCDPTRAWVRSWSLLNRKERGGIAFPAAFLIAPDGVILFRSLDRLMTRVNPRPVLTFLERWRADASHRAENQDTTMQVPGVKDTTLAYARKWFGRR